MTKAYDLLEDPEFERRVRERYSQFGGSSGGENNGMWQQSVENRLTDLSTRLDNLGGEMRSDFRWTWAGLAAMFVLLAGLSIQGYLLLDNRMQLLTESVSDLVASTSLKGGASSP